MKNFGRAGVPAAILAMAVGCGSTPKSRPVLRIGTNQSAPTNFWNEKGKPVGFAVSVIEEAARRAGIELKWVRVDSNPDEPLRTGKVDLWPFVTVLEERRSLMHLTQPYWEADAAVISLDGPKLAVWEDLAAKRVAITPAARALMHSVGWPQAVVEQEVATSVEGLERVCRGQSDALWSNQRSIDELLLDRPAVCEGKKLSLILPPKNGVRYAIGSTFAAAEQAERLRTEVSHMAREGFLIDQALKWRVLRRSDSEVMRWMLDMESRQLRVQYGAVLGILTLGALLLWIRRLKHARRMAEEASISRSRFLANMSHELRTPMNGVLGMLDLTLQTPLSGEQREHLHLARSSAQSLLGLLNDILDFSRIDSGKLKLEKELFPLHEVIVRSARLVAPRAHEKGVEILIEGSTDLPRQVVGDAVRLQQVLLNLLGNAVKFTEQGRIILRAGVGMAGHDSMQLWFQIDDTGIGIAPELQKRIFESFTQADGSITRRYGGSGLGLAISSTLARLMGGSIEVRSQSGVGSCFTFHAIFGRATQADNGQETTTLVGKRVLIIKESLPAARLLEEYCRRWGMQTLAESDPRRALDALSVADFDAILLSAGLPDGGCQWLCRELQEGYSATPLILLCRPSKLADEAAVLRRLGTCELLIEPIWHEDLRQRLCVAFGRIRGEVILADPQAEPERRLSILVAEDNRVNQIVVQKILEKAGHRVTIAGNGLEALNFLHQEEFDVALFDVQMPEMGGLEAIAEWRKFEEQRRAGHLPVIALTAHALAGDRERFLAAGMDEYLSKPIEASRLLELVIAAGNRRSEAPATR